MQKRVFAIMAVLILTICSTQINVKAASSIPVITNPTQRSAVNSNYSLTITWNAPAGSVSKYIISVRHLSNNNEVNSLIVDKVNLSSSTRSYIIPWSKLAYASTYRISVCAVMSNGQNEWSDEIYFFTTTHKVVANNTMSFYFYSGFSDAWMDAIYYAARSWNNVLTLGYDAVNTFPKTMTHSNNNKVISGDGYNRITNAPPDDFESYVMRTTGVQNSSGKIIEADININTYLYNFTVGASPGYFDIQSGMTHEMGHVVGMPHCFEPFSAAWTMYAHGATNDISKRSLETGDNYMFSCIYLNI